MHNRYLTSSIAVVAVLVVALAAFTGGAAADGHTPTDNTTYDIYDGASVDIYDAADANSSQLVVETSNSSTISSINASIEYNETDSDGAETRELTLYTADNDSVDYSRTQGVDANDDGIVDSDRHTWTINHSEFRDAPVRTNDTTTLYAEVVAVNGTGNAATLDYTFTLANADDRSVVVVDDASLDDGGVGASATTETEETGTFSFVPYVDAETDTDYIVEETRAIDGSETDVEYRFKGEAADGVSETVSPEDSSGFSFGSPEPSDGELIFEMASTADGSDVVPVYLNEAGDTVDSDADTYAVYDDTNDVLTISYGEDYAGTSSVEPYVATHRPTDETLDASSDELAEAYGHVDFTTRMVKFGVSDAISISRSDVEPKFGLILPLAVAPAARQRRGKREETA